MRVRSPVSSSDMLHISTNCRTAEKMALTMLDYLFHREVQAVSNLSGQGKHGKKQLDPLMIYGIRCESVCLSILFAALNVITSAFFQSCIIISLCFLCWCATRSPVSQV